MCFKIGTFYVPYNWGNQMYLQKSLFCQKRSVVFMRAGWSSPPQRSPVCVLELHQLCFLMLCDLICPGLLLLALRLIFNMCSACASTIEPVCQMAVRRGRRTMDNTLYLVANRFSYSSGVRLSTRASPLTTVPAVYSLFFAAPLLTDSLNMSGKWVTGLPDPVKVHLPR